MVVRPQHPAKAATRSAFTLLEVLIVVAILVVLAGVSSIYVFRYLEEAKVDRCKADVQTIAKAAQAYQIRHGHLPESILLLIQPTDGALPYLENGVEAIRDPWGQQYQYNPAGPNNGGLKPDVWTVSPSSGVQIGNWVGAH
jgi:general secretion pathway protein G